MGRTQQFPLPRGKRPLAQPPSAAHNNQTQHTDLSFFRAWNERLNSD